MNSSVRQGNELCASSYVRKRDYSPQFLFLGRRRMLGSIIGDRGGLSSYSLLYVARFDEYCPSILVMLEVVANVAVAVVVLQLLTPMWPHLFLVLLSVCIGRRRL